jgi:hypothetical protein
MTTDTQRDDPVLLGAAEAIVEAEWIRLTLDDNWEREVGELSAEKPTLRPLAPADRWPTLDCPGRQVWATQRSPPQHVRSSHLKDGVEQRR